MIKEFEENVKKLFHTITTKQDTQKHTAAELLDLLKCKVTLPVKTTWEDDSLKMVYYNVSLDIKNDLSSMTISYNKDYMVDFRQLTRCDLHQLADFILALERDIPKWKHIWVADDKLRKERAKIEERRKTARREIRLAWTTCEGRVTEEMEQDFRIRFYNIKALELMLNNDIPFWKNKKTEAEILDQCNLYHIDPPMEQWFDEWTAFSDECQKEKNERERKREEYLNHLMKIHHLINIKLLKINALIKTIELHPSLSVSTDKQFLEDKGTKYGSYHIKIKVNGAPVLFSVKYDHMDACMGKIIESIKKTNDLMPALQRTLIKDTMRHFVHVDSTVGYYGLFDRPVKNPLRIVERTEAYSRPITFKDLDSCKVIDRINVIFNELQSFITDGGVAA